MKAADLNLARDLKLSVETGVATMQKTRIAIFDVDAMGLLRQTVLEKLGWEKTREVFFRFGFVHGYSDFMQIKMSYQFETEMDYLAAGPVIHTWEGIVKATPTHISFDRETGEFHFTGVWENSYEGEQFLTFNQTAGETICWSLSGYASGYCTAFFNKPLFAKESSCIGKGDKHCGWDIQPLDKFGPEFSHFTGIIEELTNRSKNG